MLYSQFRHAASLTRALALVRLPFRRAASSLGQAVGRKPIARQHENSLVSSETSKNILKPGERSQAWPLSSSFASYNVAVEPTPAQLSYADQFFQTSKLAFLKSNAKFRELPLSSVPEVAFLGRSNVGKSSLLNALLHRTALKFAKISKNPGRTKLMNAFAVGDVRVVGGSGKNPARHAKGAQSSENEMAQPLGPAQFERWEGSGLVILDMPGYGYASQDEWGREIVKYLTGRKQLRRTYVLVDCVHGIKSTDLQMISLLAENGVPYQMVLSKIDKILVPRSQLTPNGLNARLRFKIPEVAGSVRAQMRSEIPNAGAFTDDLLMCSAEVAAPPNSGRKIGIDNMRWAILSAVGLEADMHGKKRIISVDAVS